MPKQEFIYINTLIEYILNISNIEFNALIEKLVVEYNKIMKLIKLIYGKVFLKENDEQFRFSFDKAIFIFCIDQLCNSEYYKK